MDRKLVRWIKKERKKGFSDEVIRSSLIEHGYREDIVDESINYSNKKTNYKLYLIISAILLMMIFGTTYMLFITKPVEKDYMEETVIEDIPNKIVCETLECFDDRFRSCYPAEYHHTPTQNTAIRYIIIGKKNGKCEVRQTVIENVDPMMVGDNRFCSYDLGLTFQQAIQGLAQCR